ncbi:MAG: hypothetical protein GC164_13630 [Phycisphaera sp.]|nr:hypothetical protein [Phycisphaera sp.]
MTLISKTSGTRNSLKKSSLGLLLATGLIVSVASQAHATLTYTPTGSFVTYSQFVLEPTLTIKTPTNAPSTPGYPGFGINATNSVALSGGTVSSTAKAGVGYTTSSNAAGIVFQPGTLITQSDPGSASDANSLMQISFAVNWTVSDAAFGSPIFTNFNLPVQANVGVGGFATAQVKNMTWEKVGSATPLAQFGSDFGSSGATLTFTNPTGGSQVQLGTINYTGVVLPPSSPLQVGDTLRLTGVINFRAENTNSPTSIGVASTQTAFHVNTFDTDGSLGSSPSTSYDASSRRGTDNGQYINNNEVPFVLGQGVNYANKSTDLAPVFNGNSQINTKEVSDFAHDFSLSFYFKTPEYNNEGSETLLNLVSETGDEYMNIRLSSGGYIDAQFSKGSSEAYRFLSSYDIGGFDDDMWHHILATGVRDEDLGTTELKLWVDGQLVDENVLDALFGGDGQFQLTLGAEAYVYPDVIDLTEGASGLQAAAGQTNYITDFYSHLTGQIDEVMIYDYALDPDFEAPVQHTLIMLDGYDPNNQQEPGQSAVAGDSVVPEPVTASLALLGSTALFGYALGRRRRA